MRKRKALKRPRTSAPAAGSTRRRQEQQKNTHPEGYSRREAPAATKLNRKLDAHPDRVDVRDWFYQPTLAPLPDRIVNCARVPQILDQGNQGACTGFALAAVINFHLGRRRLDRHVSPRMLYEMARRYDEWPGENYEGSSARGAMKGWVAHGVCSEESWPIEPDHAVSLNEKLAEEAQRTPGGAYYRVMHRSIRDMHAALAEVGILYVTLMVHKGWDEPGPNTVAVPSGEPGAHATLRLPVIQRKGPANDGHAVAIVGYTADGFIIQNSWGKSWGRGGFALLPYEDYMLHATDVWVAQLGVPVHMTYWTQHQPDELAGLHRATRALPLSEIRPYVVDVGNNGELSRSGTYWTSKEDVRRLFDEVIPERTKNWSRRRVMLYLHGGLNDEKAVAERIIAYRDVMLANEIYPLHIMWESGVWETLGGILGDFLTDVDERAGSVGDWLRSVREGLIEAKDRSLELTLAGPGGALWREMKENARLASDHPDQLGGMQLIAQYAGEALKRMAAQERARWQVHVVGHSAGSIFAAHAMKHLVGLGSSLTSVQFMAPAISIADFKRVMLPYITAGQCPVPTLFNLSDEGERDDDVGPYGKSLLYLVSNAFEPKREEPILGMTRFLRKEAGSSASPDAALSKLFAKSVGGRPALVISGSGKAAGSRSESETHGGFDNDKETMNSILQRILNGAPKREFSVRDLQFEGKSGSSRAGAGAHRPPAAARLATLQSTPANNQSLPGLTSRRARRSA